MVLEAHARRRMMTIRPAMSDPTEDPVEHAFDYIDRVTRYLLEAQEPMCLVAALTIELAEVNDRFRTVCADILGGWRQELTDMFGAALAARGLATNGTQAEELASQFIASFHGGLLLNRAMRDPARISETMGMFRHHLELMLT